MGVVSVNRYRRYTIGWWAVGFVVFVVFVNVLDWYPEDLLRWLWICLGSIFIWKTHGRSLGVVRISGDERTLSVRFGLSKPEVVQLQDIRNLDVVKYSGKSGWHNGPMAVPFGIFPQRGIELTVANGQAKDSFRIPTRDTTGLSEYLSRVSQCHSTRTGR